MRPQSRNRGYLASRFLSLSGRLLSRRSFAINTGAPTASLRNWLQLPSRRPPRSSSSATSVLSGFDFFVCFLRASAPPRLRGELFCAPCLVPAPPGQGAVGLPYSAYRPASITCRAICRPIAIVSAGSCLANRRTMAIWVLSMSPSATAAITLRAASSTV